MLLAALFVTIAQWHSQGDALPRLLTVGEVASAVQIARIASSSSRPSGTAGLAVGVVQRLPSSGETQRATAGHLEKTVRIRPPNHPRHSAANALDTLCSGEQTT